MLTQFSWKCVIFSSVLFTGIVEGLQNGNDFKTQLPFLVDWHRLLSLEDYLGRAEVKNENVIDVASSPTRGWVNKIRYASADCKGSIVGATGEALNVCIPIFQASFGRHRKPTQSYMLTSCTPTQYVRSDYNSSGNCTGTFSSTKLSPSCGSIVDPDTGITVHISSGVCTLDQSIPRSIVGVVIETDYEHCNGPALTYTAKSTLQCQINPENSWTNLYSLSTSYLCAGSERQPQVLGYVGKHCSFPAYAANLSLSCQRSPFWSRDSAPYRAYTCIPKQKRYPQATGFCYTHTYDSSDCSGSAIMTSGFAIGSCYVGISNTSVAVSSMSFNASGSSIFSSIDCTGSYKFVHQNTFGCQKLRHQRMTSSGQRLFGASSQFSCTNSPVIPKPTQNSIIQSLYSNDVCFDTPVQFAAYALDRNISFSYGNALYSCESGLPTLTTILTNNSFSSSTTFLSTRCSYENPSYTPGAVVLYSSAMYSSCPVTQSTATTSSCNNQQGNSQNNGNISAGGVAGLVIAFIIISSATTVAVMHFVVYKRRRAYDAKESSLSLTGAVSGQSPMEFDHVHIK